jgi:hypothetical protein
LVIAGIRHFATRITADSSFIVKELFCILTVRYGGAVYEKVDSCRSCFHRD